MSTCEYSDKLKLSYNTAGLRGVNSRHVVIVVK